MTYPAFALLFVAVGLRGNAAISSFPPYISIGAGVHIVGANHTDSVVANEAVLDYIHIPKTASTAIFTMLSAAKKTNILACHNVFWHGHTFFPDSTKAEGKSFTVIRSPCERFVSQWKDFRAALFREASARNGKCKGVLDKDGERALQTPVAWAEYLLQNVPLSQKYLHDKDWVFQSCPAMLNMWQQSSWVASNTRVACLPNMVDDVNLILAQEAPGCHFAESVSPGLRHNDTRANDEHLCNLAKRLYADDVSLWNNECGAKHGLV